MPDTTRTFQFSLRFMLLSFTIVTVIVAGAFALLRSIEQTVLNAYRVWGTGDMLVEYITSNGGRWPKNWDDIRLHMEAHPSQFAGMTSFQDVRTSIDIDFTFDPTKVDTTIDFDEDAPAFRAVWLRNGRNTRYEGTGPNEIIFRYLKQRECAARRSAIRPDSEQSQALAPAIEPDSNGTVSPPPQ